VRVHGALRQLEDFPVLMPNETQAMSYLILTQRQRERPELELDCAHALPERPASGSTSTSTATRPAHSRRPAGSR
jgi:hypothetical protein